MICQICKQNPASIHVTEMRYESGGDTDGPLPAPQLSQKNLCEGCAQGMQLPQFETQKVQQNIWKLLQNSARKARQEGSLSCPECGMTLAEFRAKGRLGCPNDYRVFQAHLQPLLQRVHNACEHKGRIPGGEAAQPAPQEGERDRHLTRLRSQLEAAIRSEAYESAARLRDEIQELESRAPNTG